MNARAWAAGGAALLLAVFGLALVFLGHASNDPPDESWVPPAGDAFAQALTLAVRVLGPALLLGACAACALAVRGEAVLIGAATLCASCALALLVGVAPYGMLAALTLAPAVATGLATRAPGAMLAALLTLGAGVAALAAADAFGWAYLAAFSCWALLPGLAGTLPRRTPPEEIQRWESCQLSCLSPTVVYRPLLARPSTPPRRTAYT